MSAHIYFVRLPAVEGKKTASWAVLAKADHVFLGTVKWFARWYQYSFFPQIDTVFERTCLRDIADFCETETKSYRSTWSKKP